jgi:hypothetical protein
MRKSTETALRYRPDPTFFPVARSSFVAALVRHRFHQESAPPVTRTIPACFFRGTEKRLGVAEQPDSSRSDGIAAQLMQITGSLGGHLLRVIRANFSTGPTAEQHDWCVAAGNLNC